MIQNLKQNQPFFLVFEQNIYPLPVSNLSIRELKIEISIKHREQGTSNKPDSYQCFLANGKVLEDEEIIQNIPFETFPCFIFINLPRIRIINFEKNFHNLIELEDNKIQKKQQEQYYNQIVFYGQTQLLIKIPYEQITIYKLKKKAITELESQSIFVNEQFSQMVNEQCIFNDDEFVNPASLLQYKEWLEKKICLTRDEQITAAIPLSKKKNEIFNLKIALESLNKKEKALFKMFPLSQIPDFSRLFFIGPKKTPYSDGIYELITKIPEEYPFKPPQFYFLTKIYHPNIINCKIAINQIEKTWKPVSTFESAIQIIIGYLNQPNLQCIIDYECAEQYISNNDSFCQVAEEYNRIYANPDIEVIIQSLVGEIPKFDPLYSELLEDFEEWIIHWVHELI